MKSTTVVHTTNSNGHNTGVTLELKRMKMGRTQKAERQSFS